MASEEQCKARRRASGEGGISAYQTKAGERFLIKYNAPAVDGVGTRQVMRRGFPTREAAAAALSAALAEVDTNRQAPPSAEQWARLAIAHSPDSAFVELLCPDCWEKITDGLL